MRLRTLSAALALTAAVVGIGGCRSNVGNAATVDGQRITESDVNNYLTAKAQTVPVQNSDGSTASIPPRSYVLENLIDERLLTKVLKLTPGGFPSEGEISQLRAQGLGGKTETQVAESAGVVGYSPDFYKLWVRNRVLGLVLNNDANSGVDVSALVKRLHFPVSVSGRYGTWDPKNLALSTDPAAALPSFLKLQPTPGAAAASGAN